MLTVQVLSLYYNTIDQIQIIYLTRSAGIILYTYKYIMYIMCSIIIIQTLALVC